MFTCIWPKLLYLWIIQTCNYCIWCITGYNCGNEKQCSSAADCICLPNHKDINLRCSHWRSTLQPLIKILANSCSSFPLQSKFHGVFRLPFLYTYSVSAKFYPIQLQFMVLLYLSKVRGKTDQIIFSLLINVTEVTWVLWAVYWSWLVTEFIGSFQFLALIISTFP